MGRENTQRQKRLLNTALKKWPCVLRDVCMKHKKDHFKHGRADRFGTLATLAINGWHKGKHFKVSEEERFLDLSSASSFFFNKTTRLNIHTARIRAGTCFID